MIQVDKSKCGHCHACVAECPLKSLAVLENQTIQIAPSVCIACGHCAAVCSFNAIRWSGDSTYVPFRVRPDSGTGRDIFHATRSVRSYRTTAICRDIINSLIADAETAPTGDNFRNREYVIIDKVDTIRYMEKLMTAYFKKTSRFLTPAVLKLVSLYSRSLARELTFTSMAIKSIVDRKLENAHTIFRNAPCVIFIVGLRKSIFAKDDCVAAQNYLRLSATRKGLGSCIIAPAQESRGFLEKFLAIDGRKRVYAATVLGYPAYEFIGRIEYPAPNVVWR